MLTHLIPAGFVQRHKQFKSVEILRKLSMWSLATHTHTQTSTHKREPNCRLYIFPEI